MKRDKKFISENLIIKDNKILTKVTTIIEFPKRFLDTDLAVIDKRTYVYVIFAINIGEKYSVSVIPAYIESKHLFIKESVKDGTEYVQFYYGPNMTLIESTEIIRNKVLTYNILNEFYLKSNIPWYIEYTDLNSILGNMKTYADSDIGASSLTNEIITSYITRNYNDKKIYHRLKIDEKYEYVSLDDLQYAAIGTLNKIAGAYFREGLTSALVIKEKSPTKLEDLARR